jgi:hypothetical protein
LPMRSVPEEKCPQLSDGLQQFLQSPRVNERTDDDKTLILATRLSSSSLPEPRDAYDVPEDR